MRGAGRLVATLTVSALSAAVLAACGGSSAQDSGAPKGRFPVAISAASFPAHQTLAQHSQLTIAVRNTGSKPLPDVAVTICNVTCTYPAPVGEGTSVAPFAQYLNMPNVASHSRPVWIIDRPPGPCKFSCAGGGEGSYFTYDANTWAAGTLKPGHTAKFTWAVTAVASGTHVVAWEVSGDLYGKAKAVLPNGASPGGTFKVYISHSPQQSYVNGQGQVVGKH